MALLPHEQQPQEYKTDEAVLAVRVQNVEPIGFWHGFCVQSDVTSSVVQETWYGHHAPFCRILFIYFLGWVLPSCMLEVLPLLFLVPIFRPMSKGSMDELRQAHSECIDSLCEAVADLPLECVVREDGQSAFVDFAVYSELDGPDILTFPPACVIAATMTFGDIVVDAHSEANFGLLSIRNNRQEDNGEQIVPTLYSLLPDCTIAAFDLNENLQLLNFTQMAPGERTGAVIEPWVCPDAMSPEAQDTMLPKLAAVYNRVLQHHLMLFPGLLFVALCIVGPFFMLGAIAYGYMICFLPTVILRRTLPWPQDIVGMQSITFWSSCQTLSLLTVLTSELQSVYLPIVLSATAYLRYDNKAAAVEWAFLGVLVFGATGVYPVLDETLEVVLQKLDGLNLLRTCGEWVASTIPGVGWWKLVRVYIFCRAYSPLRQHCNNPPSTTYIGSTHQRDDS